ncbi:MAG TPA: hypothetical protein DHW42_02565 [Candidatus Marinimicrobia bacterium]|nr:hypothetical protein [Candidatus Neomarinimicrobiota bacterium]
MVKGLDIFKEHFKDYEKHYVLIGGAACTVAMEDAGMDFRATSDLDIVLYVEALDRDFVEAFWIFIDKGEYENRQKSTGKRLFYRFHTPRDVTFPKMLELFSRKPDSLDYKGTGHLTPIPIDEEISSLSAILLNDEYYDFIHRGKRNSDGLMVVIPEYLIPLKARAWLDLNKRKEAGENIDANDINKHKNDVFRLYPLLSLENRVVLPESIKADLSKFISQIEGGVAISLKNLGLRNTYKEEILYNLKSIYNLE